MRALRRMRRLLALPSADQRKLAAAWVALAVTDARLRALGFRRTVRRIERKRRVRAATPAEVERARRAAGWLDLASRHHIARAHCLHRALALHGALRRAGLESELRIGVRREADALLAHAWVELAGEVVTDPASAVARFAPLAPTTPLATASARHELDAVQWSGLW